MEQHEKLHEEVRLYNHRLFVNRFQNRIVEDNPQDQHRLHLCFHTVDEYVLLENRNEQRDYALERIYEKEKVSKSRIRD